MGAVSTMVPPSLLLRLSGFQAPHANTISAADSVLPRWFSKRKKCPEENISENLEIFMELQFNILDNFGCTDDPFHQYKLCVLPQLIYLIKTKQSKTITLCILINILCIVEFSYFRQSSWKELSSITILMFITKCIN